MMYCSVPFLLIFFIFNVFYTCNIQHDTSESVASPIMIRLLVQLKDRGLVRATVNPY